MNSIILMYRRMGKAAILVCLLVAFTALCLTGCQTGDNDAGGAVTATVSSAEQLAQKLADAAVTAIELSGNVTLTEPVQIVGNKTVTGSGTICAAADSFNGEYLIEVASGARLTLGGSVIVDAAGEAGGIRTAQDAVLTLQDQAAVRNASAQTANVLVEGFFDMTGGNLSGASGHSLINRGETNLLGGEIRGSGKQYAGVYSEGTLQQNGTRIIGAYNNIVCASGSFTWNEGTNESAGNDGVVIAPGASLSITSDAAKLINATNVGIQMQGKAVIDNVTISSCINTLIKVGPEGDLTLNGGMLIDGYHHGIDNAGTMVMNGGSILACADSGIVNTGKLEVKGGGISDHGNKGILNMLKGNAKVVSSDVTISGNRFAIGNQDQAYFELSKASILLSTTTNIYAYGGQMYIHDIDLNASSSNNVRVVEAEVKMENVNVLGNASTGSQSMHGILLEGGSVDAKNVSIRNTTGAGIRNKGGDFTGDNITLDWNNYIGIYTSNQDVTDRPSTTVIKNLTVSNQGYMSVSSNGSGLLEITDAVFDATPSNNIRVNGGTVKLTNVAVNGHTEAATTAHHGVYLEGGEIIASNLTISNTKGNGLRNKSGDFTGTNVTIKNVNGDSAVSNVMLADGTSGSITLYNVSFANVKSKNVVCEAGTIRISGSYLAPAPGSNIKITGGAVVLNNVTVAGNQKVGEDALHAIILENGYGALYMDTVTITDAKDAGIRNKTGMISGTNVTIKDCGSCAISNGQDTKRNLKGTTKIDGLTTENCATNNIVADAGEVYIVNGQLGSSESNSIKTSGSALISLTNTVVDGSTGSYGVIAEGGTIELTDVTIRNVKTAGIRVNKPEALVTGKNVVIENTGTHGLFVDKGTVIIDGLTTANIGERNIQVGANENKDTGSKANGGTVKVSNALLCMTEKQHSVVAYGENAGTLLELTNVVLEGSGSGGGSRHVLLAEGGNMKLTDVTIKNANNAALRVNKAASTVEAENLTIEGGNNGVSASAGKVTIKNLIGKASNRNIAAEGATIVVDGATLGTTTTHNIKINKGSLTLKNATMEGSSARGIMIEPGASDGQPIVNLESVSISNTKSCALENRGGIVTAADLTITASAGNAIQNQLHKDGKTAGSITVENYNCSGSVRSINNDAGTVTVTGGTLGSTNGHNVKAAAGTVTLTDVVIDGTTSNSGIMAEGGSFVLTNVTIKNTKVSGIRVNRAASTVTATNLTVQGVQESGIYASAGTVNVTNYITSGNYRNIDVAGATVTVTDAALGATTTHNVKTASGSLTLTNASIAGSSTYGIICEGGTITARDITVKNTSGAAVRVNKAAANLSVTNLTVEGCAGGISADAGTVTVDTLTSNTNGVNVISAGAVITLKNANLSNDGTANIIEHKGGTLNLENITVGTAGESFSQIFNTAENLNISGSIRANILNGAAVAVNVTGALTSDSAIVIDWTEGNAPTGTAISFAEGTVAESSGCFTLGAVQSQLKQLVFVENTGILENLANYVAQVGTSKFESLEEALALMNQLTGDVTLTILADCGSEDPIVVPAGMNLTVQGDKVLVGLDAPVKVSQGASLTIGENVNITHVDASQGGTIVYAGNCASVEAPMTVVVKGEAHEVALTLAEGNTATAEMFSLVDAQGNAYGSMLEDGKIKVYTKDVTDEATLLAAVDGAPENKRGYIIVAGDVTLSKTLTFSAGKRLTVMDDGAAVRTISRSDAAVDMIVIEDGAEITIKSSGSSVKLVLDGNSVGNNGLAMVRVTGGSANIHNISITNANKNYNLFCSGGSLTVSATALGKNYEVSSVYVTGGKVSLTDVTVDDAGSNSIRAQGGEIALHNVTINGHTRSASIHSIMVDGGTVTSTGTLTMRNSKGSAIRVSKGSFTGENLTVTNVAASAININGGTVTVNNATMQNSGTNMIVADGGVVNLSGTVTITGVGSTGSQHGIYVNGGTVNATGNLNITANKGCAVRISNKGGTFSGENVTLEAPANYAVNMDAGNFTVTKGGTIHGTRSFQLGVNGDASAASVNLTGVTLKLNASGQNNIKAACGTLTLTNVTIEGAGNHGIIMEGGTPKLILNSVTINNATGSAIRVKKGTVEGTNVTIDGAAIGIYNEAAANVVTIDGLKLRNTTTGVDNINGQMNLSNVTGGTILVKKGSLSVSGQVATSITIHNASALNVTGAITAGSGIVIDWAEGSAPADTAIAFASAEDMAASQSYFTLGPIQTAADKALKFTGTKAILIDATVVTTAQELTNALNGADDLVFVKLAGGTEFAVENLTSTAKEVIIRGEAGAVIKYSGSTKNANLLNLASGTKLTLDGVTLDGNNVGKVMIESGETVVMKNCTVQNAKSVSDRSIDVSGSLVIEGNLNLNNLNWALCAQLGGRITSAPGSKVTMTGCTYGVVLHNASSIHLNSLDASGIANNPVYVDNKDGVVVIDQANIVGGKNSVHLLAGSLTLNNATIKDSTTYGIYLKNTTSCLYGTNIHIENTGNSPINADNGIVDIANLSTANLKSSHSVKITGTSNVTITGMNLGVSNSNAVRLDKKATLNLAGVCVISGTKSNNGIAFGAGQTVNISGDFTTTNIASKGILSWGGVLNISGKVNTDISFETTGIRTLNVTGALTAGSNVVVDWSATSIPDGTAIQFSGADVLNASKGCIALGPVTGAKYELTYGETTATLTAIAAASDLAPEAAPEVQ